jgi:hypothetical protein
MDGLLTEIKGNAQPKIAVGWADIAGKARG